MILHRLTQYLHLACFVMVSLPELWYDLSITNLFSFPVTPLWAETKEGSVKDWVNIQKVSIKISDLVRFGGRERTWPPNLPPCILS